MANSESKVGSNSSSYAGKKSYASLVKSSLVLPSPLSTTSKNVSLDNPSLLHIFQTYSANALIADFSGHRLTQLEVVTIVTNQLSQVEGFIFLNQGQAVEVSFSIADA